MKLKIILLLLLPFIYTPSFAIIENKNSNTGYSLKSHSTILKSKKAFKHKLKPKKKLNIFLKIALFAGILAILTLMILILFPNLFLGASLQFVVLIGLLALISVSALIFWLIDSVANRKKNVKSI